MTNNIETIFEDTVCPNCFTEGMVGNGSDTYICPTCYCEGSLYEDCIFEECYTDEDILMDKICPECGASDSCEFITDEDGDQDGDSYRCTVCGHIGSMLEDEEAKNYYWEEMLCGYPEGEKGEVND